jgi:hypothetical protein
MLKNMKTAEEKFMTLEENYYDYRSFLKGWELATEKPPVQNNMIKRAFIYLADLLETWNLDRSNQVRQRAYGLLETEVNELIAEYITAKLYKAEVSTVKKTMEQKRTINFIKELLKK